MKDNAQTLHCKTRTRNKNKKAGKQKKTNPIPKLNCFVIFHDFDV